MVNAMDDPQDEDPHNAKRIYMIRLLIKHPTIDPALITARLGLVPRVTHTVGHPRRSPIGTPLPGVYEESAWGYSFEVEGRRHFTKDIVPFLSRLEESGTFLRELTDSGGSIALIIHLPGRVNIGDDIRWQDLQRMAALHMDLGIEVFPDYRPSGQR